MLLANNFTIKWTLSQVFFNSILSPPMLPHPANVLTEVPYQILKSFPNGGHSSLMFSTPVGNPEKNPTHNKELNEESEWIKFMLW